MRLTVVVGYVVLALWCVQFWRCVRSSFLDSVQKWSSVVWRWLGRRAPRDEVEEHVNEIISTRKSRRRWELYVGLAVLTAPFFVLRFLELHAHGVWGTSNPDTLRTLMFFEQSTTGLTFWSILFALVSLRGRCSKLELHLIAVFFQVYVALSLWSTRSGAVLERRVVFYGIGRLMFALVTDLPFVMALNVVSSVSLFVRLHWSCLSDATPDIIVVEFFLGCSTTLACAVYDNLMRRETRMVLKATVVTTSERAAYELLSLVCDAVVTMDGSIRLEAPSPSLGALLFNTSPQPFNAVDVTNLIDGNDTDRFRDFIDAFVCPQSMHLHLLDASGGRVAVQLFHTRLERLDGLFSHVLGFCEEPEVHFMRQPPHVVHDLVESRAAQRSTLSEDLVSLSSGGSDCLECSCTLDLRSKDLKLLECSPCFTAITGPVQGGVLPWIVGDAKPFHQWLVRSANQLTHGGDLPPTYTVMLSPHHNRPRLISAVCHVVELQEIDLHDEDDDAQLGIKIVLANVKKHKRTVARSSGSGKTGT